MARHPHSSKRGEELSEELGGRQKSSVKSVNDGRRFTFRLNMEDLVSKVLRMSRVAAANEIGVEVSWLRKACSLGISRPDPRNEDQLRRVCDYFRIDPEDLWRLSLVYRIYAGNYLPETLRYFNEKFDFRHHAERDKDFQTILGELRDNGVLPPKTPEGDSVELRANALRPGEATYEEFLRRAEGTRDSAFIRTARELVLRAEAGGENITPGVPEMLEELLSSGSHEYLRQLILDLYLAHRARSHQGR